MFPVWIFLAILAALGFVMFVSIRLSNESLAHEGLCPVCSGEGGPCEYCNGYGIIVDATKAHSRPPQVSDSSQKTQKSLR